MLYFGRYRDDCFSIWKGSDEKLNSLFNFMNSINDNEDLQFTMEIGKECLSFLDLKISIINNKLVATVYS